MSKMLACVLVLFSSVGLQAQRTYIVDAKNGMGAHFTDIQPAVNAAADGDTLLVRAGSYGGFHANKSISIIALGAAIVNRRGTNPFQALSINGLTVGKVLRIYGLTFALPIVLPGGPTVSNCRGRVLLESVSLSSAAWGLRVSNSTQVWLASCTLFGVLDITNSRVTAADCTLFGIIRQFPQPGVSVRSSNLTLSRCSVQGAGRSFFIGGSPGIVASTATLMLTSDGTGAIGAGTSAVPVPAITGSGSLVLDPNVVLRSTNNSPLITGLSVTRRTVPSLRTRNAALGGQLRVDLYSPANGPFFLFVGLAIPAVDVPVLGGAIWIAPPLLVARGVQNATGRFSLSVTLPTDPRLIGFVFAWQGYAGKTPSSLYLSNASAYVHR